MKKTIIAILSVFAMLFVLTTAFRQPIKEGLAKLLFQEPAQVITETRVREITLKPGDYVYLGSYQQQPILWKVLRNDAHQPLLFSDKILAFGAFAPQYSDWETSELRTFLNGNFLLEFDEASRRLLLPGNEQVFVLSRKELEALPVKDRRKSPTQAAAIADGSSYFMLRKTAWYWTHDPVSTNACSVTAVTSQGGFYKTLASDKFTGICPATRLAGDTITCLGGDGSRGEPYWLAGEEKH